MRLNAVVGTAVAAALLVAGCAPSESGTTEPAASSSAPTTVKLVTHDSFALSEELLVQFQAETGYEVVIIAPGDGGALVNQLILTKDTPLGDVVFGIDNTYATRAIDAGILEPYTSPNAVADLPTFNGQLNAVTQGDVCLNIDKGWFASAGINPPATFEDLLLPEYRDLTVVTNPSSSTPGLAFLLGTIAHFGDGGWQQYWIDLLANGTRVADSWSDAYYVDFSGSSGQGDRPIVLSYSSSPSAEIGEDGQSRTANVEGTCVRQMEFAGVLQGGQNRAGAQALIDWLLTIPVQEDIPGQMYMYPVNPEAALPAGWEFAALAAAPIVLNPTLVAENRDRWLEEWLNTVG